MRSPALSLVFLFGLAALSIAAPPPGRAIYLPATGPTDAAGKVVAGDVRAQPARVLDNLAAMLAERGSRLELAAAVTVVVPFTVALLRGAVNDTTGGVVSLMTVTETVPDCPTLPAAS